MSDAHPAAYRPDQVPAVIGLGRTKVYELLRTGQLRSIKVGKARLVPRAAIDEFLDRFEAPAA
jgi:excisionase family DNA binding protein